MLVNVVVAVLLEKMVSDEPPPEGEDQSERKPPSAKYKGRDLGGSAAEAFGGDSNLGDVSSSVVGSLKATFGVGSCRTLIATPPDTPTVEPSAVEPSTPVPSTRPPSAGDLAGHGGGATSQELAELRGEVSGLRAQMAEMKALNASLDEKLTRVLNTLVPKDHLTA